MSTVPSDPKGSKQPSLEDFKKLMEWVAYDRDQRRLPFTRIPPPDDK